MTPGLGGKAERLKGSTRLRAAARQCLEVFATYRLI